jgi:hypothetical protein
MRALQRELDALRDAKAQEAREHEEQVETLRERCEQLENEQAQNKNQVSNVISIFSGLHSQRNRASPS